MSPNLRCLDQSFGNVGVQYSLYWLDQLITRSDPHVGEAPPNMSGSYCCKGSIVFIVFITTEQGKETWSTRNGMHLTCYVNIP